MLRMLKNSRRSTLYSTMAAFAVLVVSLTASLAASQVEAQTRMACAERASLMDHLSKNYNEKPNALGLDARGNMVELFNSSNGTWTIVVTIPGGPTCILASGQNWMQQERSAKRDVEERSS
ncbi:MAG: hypothetical protein HOL85_10615 [Rhodospirillaceae bacterium]|nr:hypothetical protein [Rhodospirillaceae bacterium]